jgi:general secretion pathway protein J
MMLKGSKVENSAAGFTLLEALVALALMAIIVSAIATMTSQWLPNWNRGLARLQTNEHVALGLERLTADIASAEFVSPAGNVRQPLFEGTSHAVTFVRTKLNPDARRGLELVRIAEIRTDSGPATVRMTAPFAPVRERADQRQPVFSEPVVLLKAPYALKISYAGKDQLWHDLWHLQIQLPWAVKLTIEGVAPGRTMSIATIAVVRSQLPVDCLDANSSDACLTAQLRPTEHSGSGKSGT